MSESPGTITDARRCPKPRIKEVLTHSRMECYRACQRRAFFRYEKRLRPAAEGAALRIGGCVHAALETLHLAGAAEAFESVSRYGLGPYEQGQAEAMIRYYPEYWTGERDIIKRIVATEVPFQIPLRNPQTKYAAHTWVLSGVIDAICELADGRRAVLEYKTTGADPGEESFWTIKLFDAQTNLYYRAARELGYEVETVLFDVLVKPGARPSKATPVEKRKYRADGALYANQREHDERPEEYAARCDALIAADPAAYYHRREIPRLLSELDEWEKEIHRTACDMRATRRHGIWQRASSLLTCRDCAYLGICAGIIEYDGERAPDGYVVVEDANPEITRRS